MSRYFPEPGDVQIVISTHRSKSLSLEEISALFAALNPILGPAVTVHHVEFDARPRLSSLKEHYELMAVQAADRIQRTHVHEWQYHLMYKECACGVSEVLPDDERPI